MKIDLRKDVAGLREMIADAVSRYAAGNADAASASSYPPVTRIDLTFALTNNDPDVSFILLNFGRSS